MSKNYSSYPISFYFYKKTYEYMSIYSYVQLFFL